MTSEYLLNCDVNEVVKYASGDGEKLIDLLSLDNLKLITELYDSGHRLGNIKVLDEFTIMFNIKCNTLYEKVKGYIVNINLLAYKKVSVQDVLKHAIDNKDELTLAVAAMTLFKTEGKYIAYVKKLVIEKEGK